MSGKGDIPNPEAWLAGPLLTGVPDPVLSQINLTWTLPAAGYPGASSITIYRADSGGSFVALVTGLPLATVAYNDTTVVSTHYYSYYVAIIYGVNGPVNSNVITLFGEIDDLFLTAGTWTKRPGLKSAQVIAIGPGAGGQGGFVTVYGAAVCEGCGGGGGGGYANTKIPGANLPATAPVTVGLGGQPGAGQSCVYPGPALAPTNGTPGTGPTSFNGTWVVANAGGATALNVPGAGGTASVTAPGATNTVTETGGIGGATSAGANSDSHRNGGSTTSGAGPGGAGGGCASGPTSSGGTVAGFVQNGGSSPSAAAGGGATGAGATNSGTNQTAGATPAAPNGLSNGAGGGGGGGGTAITGSSVVGLVATASAGAAGGVYGAGGGGGGSGEGTGGGNFHASTAFSGTGGAGVNGICVVKNLFW